jgi:hypothetical protein
MTVPYRYPDSTGKFVYILEYSIILTTDRLDLNEIFSVINRIPIPQREIRGDIE